MSPASKKKATSKEAESFKVPRAVEAEVKELITHYPEKRSASLMVLHALQDHFGYLSNDAIQWAAAKLDLKPINILEVVTFYPMFRQELAGKFEIKVCRTLSCALGGSKQLYEHICENIGVEADPHHVQVSGDGKFSVEYSECLAACGTAPVMMVNEDFHENVSHDNANGIMKGCK
ncbi:NAD(P)H-dependent oxidoreductase subunit E [Verrucomicrobia bacterium]|nr:NAD(P)H-dependent oxidoreductase subunit E [Verrucomicrobiota bacterium]